MSQDIPCPKCANRSAFIDLNQEVEVIDCYTCENKGAISQMHDDLFKLGFNESNRGDGYYMYLSKILSPLETANFEVARNNDEFDISSVSFNGPHLNSEINRLTNVGDLIDFLKK